MEKFYIDQEPNEGKLIELYQVKNEMDIGEEDKKLNLISFESNDELIKYCKEELTKKHNEFRLVYLTIEGIVDFNNKEISIDSYMGWYDNELKRDWLGIKPKRYDDEVQCTACGDGGCFHCEPHRFI